MFCPQCGNSVDLSMNFCPYCSYSLKNIKKISQVPIDKDNISHAQSKEIHPQENYNHNQGQQNPSQYQQKQNIPSFDRYREETKNENNYINNDYTDKRNQNNSIPEEFYTQPDYNPFYNPYNESSNSNEYNQQQKYIENQQPNYQKSYEKENSNYYNQSQNQSNNYSDERHAQPPSQRNRTQQQQYSNDNSDVIAGKNIYSTKNKKSKSPLLPPDDFLPEKKYINDIEESNPSYSDSEDGYDYEERRSTDPKFYNRWWFIALMILLLLIAFSFFLHFLKIFDLTKIPSFFSNIINEQIIDQESESSSETSLETSSEISSSEQSSEIPTNTENSGINDKNFYIEAGSISEKYKDKMYNLKDPIEIDGVTYELNVDDSKNIKSDDEEYILLNLIITNSSGNVLMVNPFYFTIVNEEGKVYSPSFKNSSTIPLEEVPSNKRLDGSISYKVPLGEEKLYIVFSNSENLDLAEFFVKYR